jgi:hypothetical protein
MKATLNSLVTPAFALLALSAIGAAAQQQGNASCCGSPMAAQANEALDKPVPAKVVNGVQKLSITIDGGKYSPAAISVKKGMPVELTFIGGKSLGCGGTIVFKSLNLTKSVEKGKSVVVKFTPKAAETIAFTCGMGMFDGKVVVK